QTIHLEGEDDGGLGYFSGSVFVDVELIKTQIVKPICGWLHFRAREE
ncbi:8579_t:CDS:2, partial [Acaulospora morrowiae]